VTSQKDIIKPLILEKDVTRSWCATQTILGEAGSALSTSPWGKTNRLLADHAYAIALSINSVSGANVMTDVSVKTETTAYLLWTTTCVTVTGDVGRIP
jgi:hypothetical protein